MDKKIIIWGHPPHTHTHSYINFGFAKAFSHLDYDVTWYEDSPEYSNDDLSDAIVITEVNSCKYLPIVNTSKYFVHNNVDGFQSSGKIEGDNIYNLLVYHEEYNWHDGVKNIDDFSWYDNDNKTAVIMWATDLLPDEIDEQEVVLYDSSKKDINYIGSLSDDYIEKMISISKSNDKKFNNYGGYSGIRNPTNNGFMTDEENINLMKNSYLNLDLRPDQHKNNGYISCRVFKALSYGCWIGTNSTKVNKFFDGRITAIDNLDDLYLETELFLKGATEEILKDNQEYIKKNHTYLNRIQSLLSVL